LTFVNFGYSATRKWIDIAAEFKQLTKKNVELAEAGTAAMRAILQRLVQVRANVIELNQLTCNDIQPMLNDMHQCVNTNVRVNMIRMLCNLAQIMLNKKDSKNYETIKVIIFFELFLSKYYLFIATIYFWQLVSTFLLDISKSETQVLVIAESIDAIMDIYTEDDTDHLAADIKLVPRLLSVMPHFKNKVNILFLIYYLKYHILICT